MDGQTFAIAGLINNSMNSTLQKIPGIGDIPILGLLFKSKAAQKDQTELVVMITPQILPRNSPGVTAALPSTPEPFLAPLPAKKLVEPLPPAFTPARAGTTNPKAEASPAAAGCRRSVAGRAGAGRIRLAGQLAGGRRGHPEPAAAARRRGGTEDRSAPRAPRPRRSTPANSTCSTARRSRTPRPSR